VVVSPSGTVGAAIHVATPDPVTIRGLSVRYTGTRGLFGDGVVDLTVERVSVVAVSPPLGVTGLISVINDAPTTGRARAVVRESSVDGSLPSAPSPPFAQIFGITVAGDIDARLEGNVIRRTGGACVWVRMSNNLGAETNADVLHNDLDECYPLGRAGGAAQRPGWKRARGLAHRREPERGAGRVLQLVGLAKRPVGCRDRNRRCGRRRGWSHDAGDDAVRDRPDRGHGRDRLLSAA